MNDTKPGQSRGFKSPANRRGRDVGTRSCYISCSHCVSFALATEDLGDAKVPYLDDHVVLVQEDVLSLEVPVEDLLGVDVVEGQEDLDKEVEDGLLVQEGVAPLVDELSQRPTWQGASRERPA